jgi:LysR family carnitine catabolism transcriptional activator
VPLVEPRVERRIGIISLADHKLSTAAQALSEVLLAHTHPQEATCVP